MDAEDKRGQDVEMREEEEEGEEPIDDVDDSDAEDDEDDGDEDEADDGDGDGDGDGEEGPSRAFLPGSQVLEEGEELSMDERAYVLYHQAHLGPPCLSFDLIDGDGQGAEQFPLTVFGVAGSQAAKASGNSIIAFKMFNLHPIKHKSDEDGDDDDEDEEEEDDPSREPKLKVASIRHNGAVNRVRCKTLGTTALAAAWGENGAVGIYGLNGCLQKLEQPMGGSKQKKKNQKEALDWHRESTPPIFQFRGHLTEGFALAWSPTVPGAFASGDCSKNIHLWKPTEDASWSVDQRPLVGHTDSVEDVQWSPNEENVLASCSVDRTVRVWDSRARPDRACMITVEGAHSSDVNVIDWNRNEPFLVSGGDDGRMKVWDLRRIQASAEPVAAFRHHSGPVTSVEWHHSDATVLASSGADDQIALWDLAIEKDEEAAEGQAASDRELKDLPPQLLFIHQGMQDVKEIHWHRQIPGLVVSTSHSGFDVFKTISV